VHQAGSITYSHVFAIAQRLSCASAWGTVFRNVKLPDDGFQTPDPLARSARYSMTAVPVGPPNKRAVRLSWSTVIVLLASLAPANTAAAEPLPRSVQVLDQVVDIYGGKLRAEDRLGGGAMFSFTLPLAAGDRA
jgi:hypothetical protein